MIALKNFRWLLTFLLVVALIAIGCQSSVSPTQTFHVGVLEGVDFFDGVIDGFKQQMTDDGYIEGKNIEYDVQFAHGDADAMQSIAEQFVADGVDLILTTTNGGALAARRATENTDIPVVFTIVLAPVETGLVDDMRMPGGNLTGVVNPLDKFIGKRIEYLQKINPNFKRVWLPYDPTYPTEKPSLSRIRDDAAGLGVALVETPVYTPDDISAAIQSFANESSPPFDAIMIMPDPTVQNAASWAEIKKFADARKIPILANTMQQIEDGALLGYLTEENSTGESAARMAQQVLSGIPPAELSIDVADVFLVVNMDTAQRLNIEIPAAILHQADSIIR